MIDDPSRSTVVAWYETLPEELALLVERVQVGAGRLLGDTFTPRDPTQVHATLIGLESAPAPFDPAPLAAHLREALSPPWTIRFGGFAPGDRRWRSRGLPLHERMVGVYGSKVVLIGWPIVGGEPQRILAELRLRCAEFGVTHSYGDDPDVYLVLGEVTGAPAAHVDVGDPARAGNGPGVRAALRGRPRARDLRRHHPAAGVDDLVPALRRAGP